MRAAVLLLAALAFPTLAAAQSSRSVGRADRGRLEAGVPLADSEHFVRLSGPGTQWGTAELVGLITRGAARLQGLEQGPRLLVGDLSLQGGGRIRPHESHQSGRDADVSMFLTNLDGEPVQAEHFVELDRRTGCGRRDGERWCIDPHRTFLFLVALLEDEEAVVRFVLIASDLRQLVLAAGRRANVTQETLDRVEEITRPRRGSASHRSHLHIRIECPENDAGCAP